MVSWCSPPNLSQHLEGWVLGKPISKISDVAAKTKDHMVLLRLGPLPPAGHPGYILPLSILTATPLNFWFASHGCKCTLSPVRVLSEGVFPSSPKSSVGNLILRTSVLSTQMKCPTYLTWERHENQRNRQVCFLPLSSVLTEPKGEDYGKLAVGLNYVEQSGIKMHVMQSPCFFVNFPHLQSGFSWCLWASQEQKGLPKQEWTHCLGKTIKVFINLQLKYWFLFLAWYE